MNNIAFLQIVVDAKTSAATAKLLALDKQLKGTAASSNKTSTAIGQKLGTAAKWGGAALAVGVAAGLVKSVKAANAFESSFAEVRKTVDASEKGFDRLESGLRKLARTIPVNVNDLNDLAGQAGALGIKSKDIVRFTRTAAELGIATDLSANDAANALARLSNIMGTSSKDFRRLGSSFVALGNDGASTEREIADMALRLAATGKQVGLNESQVLGFSSALASVGIEAEAGGSAFSRAFSQMSEAVATGNANLQGFAEVAGMGSGGFSKLFEKDAAGAMVRFIEGLGRIKKEGGNALVTLKDLDINEVRLRNSLLSAAGAGKLFRDQLKVGNEAWRENSALTKEARERYQTMDSKVQLLGNRANDLAITIGQKLDPVVRGVTDALLALTSGNIGQWLDRMAKKSQTASDIVDVLKASWKVLSAVIATVVAFARGRIEAFLQIIRSILKIFKNVVVLVKALVNGDWKGAWNAFKQIVSGAVGVVKGVVKGMYAPLKAAFVGIRTLMSNVFGSAWAKVENLFRDGANAVVDVVNAVIGVLNKIPGVEIGKVGKVAANLDYLSKDPNGKGLGRQRGGTISGGKPSGDSVPAVLERGEYVLNRKAVQAVGVERLNDLNFKRASRFQSGGAVGMIGGGLADAAGDVASGAAGVASGLAGKVLGKGAGWFIKRLPDPNLPQPFTGTGPWLMEHVEEWIKGKVPKLGGALGNVSGSLGQAMKLAQSMGLTITSTTGGTHAPGSYHYSGRAFDASNSSGPTPEMQNYFMAAASRWGGKMLELFYDPIGWYIKHGSKVSGAIGGHSDHVHTAMQKGGLVRLMAKGGEVVKIAAPILTRKGFDHKATAGILGNAWGESSWDPAAMEPGTHNGGLFGFTAYEKSLANMKAYASAHGKPWTDVGAQIGFMLKSGGAGLKGALNAKDKIFDTTKLFMDEYERPGIPRLSERVKGGFMASDIMRGMKLGGGGGMSDRDRERLQNRREMARRRENREQQVRKLIQKAFGTRSAAGKKGALWQAVDLFAKYGDFDYRPGRAGSHGGISPGINEAADMLARAGKISSIANPNRGAGQLYSLVKWLQNHVDLTGSEDANDHLSKKLGKVRDRGGNRSQKRQARIHKKLAKYGTEFPWQKALNKNARRDEMLDDLASIIGRENTAEWSELGSEYSQGEIDKERGVVHQLFATRDNRYRMLMRAIPWAEKAQAFYRKKVKLARGNPAERWKMPGYKKGLSAVNALLNGGGVMSTGLRDDLKTLIGASGDRTGLGGTRGEAYYRYRELGGMKPGGTSISGISIGDLLGIVEFAKYGGYDNLPKFHSGGIVPGRPGQEVPIMAEAGERVIERGGGTGDVRVEVNFADGMGWLKDFVDVRVVENDRRRDLKAKAGAR